MTRPKFNFSGLFSRVLQYFTLASIVSLTLQPWQAAFTKPVAPQSAASSSDMNPFEETGEGSDLMDKWNEDIYAPSAPFRPAQPLNNQAAPTPPKPSVYMKRPTLVPTDEPIKPPKSPVSLPLPTDNAPLMQKRIQHENTMPAPAAAPAQAKPNAPQQAAPAKTRKAPKETEKEKPTTPPPEQPIPQKGQNNRPTTKKHHEIRADQPKIEHQAPAATKPDAPKPMDIQKIKPSETKSTPEVQPAHSIAPQRTEKTANPVKRPQSEPPSQKSLEQPKQAAPAETKRPVHPESTSVQEKPGIQPEGAQPTQTLSQHQKEKPAKKRKAEHKPKPADAPVIEAKPLSMEKAGTVPANQPPEKKAAEQGKSGQTEKSQPKPPKSEKPKKLKSVKAKKPVAEPETAQPAQTETPVTSKPKPDKPVLLPKPKKDKPFKLPQEPVELMPFPNTDGKRQPGESQPTDKPGALAKPESETPQSPGKDKPKKEKIRKVKPPRPAKVKTEPVKPARKPTSEKLLGQPDEAMPAERVPVKAVPAEAKPKKERKTKREKPVQHSLTPMKQPPAKTQTEKPAEPLAMPVEAKQEAKPAEIKKKASKAPRPKHRAEEKQREQHLSEPGANPQAAAPKAEPATKKQAQSLKQDHHQDMGQKIETPAQKADTPKTKPEKRHRKKDKPPKQKLTEAQSKTAQPDVKGLPMPVNGNPDNEKRTGKAQKTQPNDQGKSDTPQKGRKKADKKAKIIPTNHQGVNTPASQPTAAQPPVSQGANKPNDAIQPVIPAEKGHKPPRHKKEKPVKQVAPKAEPAESALGKTTPKGKPAQTENEKTTTPLKLQTDSQDDLKQETKKPAPTVSPQTHQDVHRKDKKRKAKKQKQEKQPKPAPQQGNQNPSAQAAPQPVSAKTPEAEKKAPDQSVRHEKPRHKQKPAKPTQAEQDGNRAQTTHTDDAVKPFPNPKLGQPDGTAADAFPETEKPRKSKAEKQKQRAEQVKALEAPKPKNLHAEPASARPIGVSEPSAKTTEPGTSTPPEKSGKPAKKEKKHKTPQGETKQDAPKTPRQETTKAVQKTIKPSRPDAATPATGAQAAGEKPPVSPATPDEAQDQAPATSSLQTQTPASAPAPVSKSIQDLTVGLSPELATQFASAQDKAIAYEALLNERQHAPKPASFEPVLAKGQEAAAEILRILEYLDDASVEALSRHMPGYLLLRDEVIVVAPDPAYFREQSKKYGTPTDVTFFDLMSQTLNGYWPVTMEQLTDLSGCTRFGAHDLVKLYGGWQTFRKQHPNAYQTTLKDPNMMLLSDIEDQLLHSQAACDGPDSVVDELQTFIKTYPHSDLTPKLQTRLTAIQKKQEADMVYFQGVQHTLK